MRRGLWTLAACKDTRSVALHGCSEAVGWGPGSAAWGAGAAPAVQLQVSKRDGKQQQWPCEPGSSHVGRRSAARSAAAQHAQRDQVSVGCQRLPTRCSLGGSHRIQGGRGAWAQPWSTTAAAFCPGAAVGACTGASRQPALLGCSMRSHAAAYTPLPALRPFSVRQNKMHINDWAAIQTLFDKLNKQLDKTQKVGDEWGEGWVCQVGGGWVCEEQRVLQSGRLRGTGMRGVAARGGGDRRAALRMWRGPGCCWCSCCRCSQASAGLGYMLPVAAGVRRA